MASSMNAILMVGIEKQTITVYLTAEQPLVDTRLGYTLYGEDGTALNEGILSSTASVSAGETGTFLIDDAHIPDTSLVVVHRPTAQGSGSYLPWLGMVILVLSGGVLIYLLRDKAAPQDVTPAPEASDRTR